MFLPGYLSIICLVAVLMYVLLDGFDLGVGIGFPFAKNTQMQDEMISSVAPVWDGNETWILAAVGGVMISFPKAFAIIMPALYLPLMFLLFALAFRAASFEFRLKADPDTKHIWTKTFFTSSVVAAFCQGVILASFFSGFTVVDGKFAGGSFDFLNVTSLLFGLLVVSAYGLVGSSWYLMKTANFRQEAKNLIKKFSLYSIIFAVFANIAVIMFKGDIISRLFTPATGSLIFVAFILAIALLVVNFSKGDKLPDWAPFILTTLIFALTVIAMALLFWPNIIPGHYTVFTAANQHNALVFVATVVTAFVPIILLYTGFVYFAFRGRMKKDDIFYGVQY